jgi:hypothetical protein
MTSVRCHAGGASVKFITSAAKTKTEKKRKMRMRMSTRKANSAYRLIGQARGATLMEYALLVALGSVILIIALLAFAGFKH